ncbi:MAG: hemolysin family protein [Sporolactobacillus sp.]
MKQSIDLIAIVFLIAITAFFVAAEFAIVKVRRTRISQLIKQGDKRAQSAKRIISDLNGYLSTTQLGISVTALVLGWIGEPAVSSLIEPLLGRAGLAAGIVQPLTTVAAFLVVTFTSVVLGELAPKAIAIQRADQITLKIARPLVFLHRLLFPFTWLLNVLSNAAVRLFGFRSEEAEEQALTEGELRLTLADSFRSGEITKAELGYMTRIFDFDERTAREVMVPRTEMVCIDCSDADADSLQTIRAEKYTRYPVIRDDKDHVIGIINVKDLFNDCLGGDIQPLAGYIRPVLSVLETTPIRLLLEKMQNQRVHLAVLTDEYGGTSGMVTVEDILEEIVGEIRDEFDEGEELMFEAINSNQAVVSGKLLIARVNERFGTDIEEEGIDTIGGWLLSENATLKEGDVLANGDVRFEVLGRDTRHILKVRITKVADMPTD